MKIRNKGNEELQTRREFFKKAAKTALPFIGIVTIGPSLLSSCGGGDDDFDDYGGGGSSSSCSACADTCVITCGNTCKANAS